MVINLVSTSKLKNDFIKYEKDELEKLSAAECDSYIESLVIEFMKPFRQGRILFDADDHDEIIGVIDSFKDFAKDKFNNVDAVFLDRKFKYLSCAYFTSNQISTNHSLVLQTLRLLGSVSILEYSKKELESLLSLYHSNYSNHRLLNDLFFKLSTDDDLDVTFEIHEKYLNNEFGVNGDFMSDLDFLIKSKVETMFMLFEKIENIVDVDEIAADGFFDEVAELIKANFKELFSNSNDFEKTALINSGVDDALFYPLENLESKIAIVKIYLNIKEWFMNLYNSNGFAEISAERFKILNKKYPGKYNDFDEYMKNEPKYDLKECEFIKPEKDLIAF